MKTKPYQRLLSASLAASLAVSGFAVTALSVNALDDKQYYGIFDITFKDVNKRYTDIAAILQSINDTRTEAGLNELKLDSSLTEDSMKRAAELSIYAIDGPITSVDTTTTAYEKLNTSAARHEIVVYTDKTGPSGVINKLKNNYGNFNFVKDGYNSFEEEIKDSKVTKIGIGVVNFKASGSEARRYVCIRMTDEALEDSNVVTSEEMTNKGIVTQNIATQVHSSYLDIDTEYMNEQYSENKLKVNESKEFVYRVLQYNKDAGTVSGDRALLIPSIGYKYKDANGKLETASVNDVKRYFSKDASGNVTGLNVTPSNTDYYISMTLNAQGATVDYTKNYPVSVVENPDITQKKFSDYTFQFKDGITEYDSKQGSNGAAYNAVQPKVIGTNKTDSNDLLQEGKDYNVIYANNIQPGSAATATVIGIGEFAGEETTLNFTIKELPKVFEVSLDTEEGTKFVGDTITVTATPKDYDGTVNYTFSYEIGGETTTLQETTDSTLTFKPEKAGTYTISVTATDSGSARTATATQTINVSDQLSVSLISYDIDSYGSTFYYDDNVTLYAIANGGKGGYSYEYSIIDSNGNETSIADATGDMYQYKVLRPAGTKTIKVCVKDENGATAYDSIEITGVSTPYITYSTSYVTVDRIGEIRPDEGIYVGDTVKIRANAAGGIGGIEYQFSVSDGSKSASNSTGEFEFTPSNAGNYTVTITATDTGGRSSSCDTNEITVKEKYVDNSDNDFDQNDTTKLAGNSLSLDGDIGINFYMILSDDVVKYKDHAYMQFTLPDGTVQKVEVDKADKDTTTTAGKTYYVFRCDVAAKEMTDTIKAQVFLNGNAVSKEYNYSVKDYANALINNSSSNADYEKAKDLVSAMLDYGAYSQAYFKYNTNNPAAEFNETTKAKISKVTAATIDKKYESSTTVLPGGVEFSCVNLELKSTTTLNLYFSNKSGKTLTFTDSDGNKFDQKDNNGYTQVVIPNIAAKDLDEDFKVIVTADGDSTDYYVTYSPMIYCYNVLNRELSATRTQELKDLIGALYLYNKAANDYFETNKT
ncbi:MAG: PKD domain-containing protein [Clostridia bacterium]|nr:PKD domain-containing protein [Clostridia bacterium]